MFYNTENFFDTFDDPKTNDNDYTPGGELHWTNKRYAQKLQNTYKVIAALGEWSPPEIIGFCEVENRRVVSDLFSQTPLSQKKYSIIHFDSPDPRGIDLAIAYQSTMLKTLQEKYIPVTFPEPYQNHATRNILSVKFCYNNTDTFYIIINHWPSRRNGEKETENFRLMVAKILKNETDSIFRKNANSKIIIMGDFNDEPFDESIRYGLNANPINDHIKSNSLYNLSTNFTKADKTGTLKFQGQWLVFDQIITSGGLLNAKKGLYTAPNQAHIFSSTFILKSDNHNLGFSPFRTYSGMKYTGGYSDHLPIYIDLLLKK